MWNEIKKIDRKSVKWKSPPSGFIKLNFHGSSKGNPRICGIGWFLWSHEGKIIVAKASKIANGSNNVAELEAFLLRIKLAKQFNISHLVIEGYSQIAINVLGLWKISN